MMTTQKYILDQHGGVVRSVIVNEDEYLSRSGSDVHFVTEQNVDGILRANARDRDVDQSKQKLRLAARVPVAVVEQAAREGWLHDKAKWRQWLNDSANRDFRVWEGRV